MFCCSLLDSIVFSNHHEGDYVESPFFGLQMLLTGLETDD